MGTSKTEDFQNKRGQRRTHYKAVWPPTLAKDPTTGEIAFGIDRHTGMK